MDLPAPAPAVRALVAPWQRKADPAHDLHHVDRVARLARDLAEAAGADVAVVTTAAYLHDLDRAGLEMPDTAAALLRDLGLPAEFRDRVLECVERVSDYSFRPPGKVPTTLEAEVLQDADKLEAIGAIGVARAFTFGGKLDRPLWDGKDLVHGKPYTKVKDPDASTLQHFADKLLRLTPEEFNTDAGKREAAHRQERLKRFLDEFQAEWMGLSGEKGGDGS